MLASEIRLDDLAYELDKSKQAVSKIMRGKTRMTLADFIIICGTLGLDVGRVIEDWV